MSVQRYLIILNVAKKLIKYSGIGLFGSIELLATPQEYILAGSESVTTEIVVKKGPGKSMKFEPITLFLRSSCVQDVEDPIMVTETLWNRRDDNNEKKIIFTPPCPAIRWAGIHSEHNKFVLSLHMLNSLQNSIEVSVFNEVCRLTPICKIFLRDTGELTCFALIGLHKPYAL